MRSALTADLGGTKVRFALVSEDGRILGVRRLATPRDRVALLAAIDDAFGAIVGERPPDVDEPAAIGVGLAGVVAPDGARVLHAPNLALDDFPLVAHLEERWRLPVSLLNDGRASALGEYAHGAAKGSDPLLVLFFGTGIGIGLVAEGRVYRGASNAAGEVGHTIHVPGGEPCSCGRRGCYEAYCGGKPIAARARRELGPAAAGDWNVAAVLAAAEHDERAANIIAQARTAAGAMVASLCTLLNPAAVVLGGGVLQGWPELRGAIEHACREWCTKAVTRDLRFVPSALESDAILLGAAAATRALADSPSRA
jgi:glucokinase